MHFNHPSWKVAYPWRRRSALVETGKFCLLGKHWVTLPSPHSSTVKRRSSLGYTVQTKASSMIDWSLFRQTHLHTLSFYSYLFFLLYLLLIVLLLYWSHCVSIPALTSWGVLVLLDWFSSVPTLVSETSTLIGRRWAGQRRTGRWACLAGPCRRSRSCRSSKRGWTERDSRNSCSWTAHRPPSTNRLSRYCTNMSKLGRESCHLS